MTFSELDIRNIVKTVSDIPEGLDFIFYLVDSFGTFSYKVNTSNSDFQNLANAIKKEQGEFILDLLREYNFEKYIEIQRKRSNEKCLKTMNC